ncbi:MAG: class I tRNA ligase family protein, partial [Candidatus Hydrogenedentes bacterium]|nr:class I tRNA ligase family protein [Candidatus Hydrogenedentota bacterium]
VLHNAIKAVTKDIEEMSFNTAISRMMEFINEATKASKIDKEDAEKFVLILAPFAPHMAEELWERLGYTDTLAYEPWPEYDESLLTEDTMDIAVQVLGKLRGVVKVPVDASKDYILEAAKAEPNVQRHIEGKNILKEIYVPGKLVNLVVK